MHNHGSKHILLYNLRSAEDMQQVGNICREMGIQVKYGLNLFDNLIIWLFDCECEPYIDAHNLQNNYCMYFAIEKLVENLDNLDTLAKQESFYRYISE